MNNELSNQQTWYTLEEYPNYEVSRDGKIRNATTGRVLKVHNLASGLGYVTIKDKDGKQKMPKLEQLVTSVFLQNPDPNTFTILKHIDGNVSNCSTDNLVWVEDTVVKDLYYSQNSVSKPDDYFTFYPVMEFPDSVYEINKMGQIRNKKTHKLLKGTIDDGYKSYTLFIDKKIVSRRAHVMVAKQFIPNPENKTIINHIDENRGNSCVDNLEWVTPSENARYGTAQKRSNLSRKKPINEYSLQGQYIRTWKSLKDLSSFMDSLYPQTNNHAGIMRAIIYNSKNDILKQPLANRVFMRYTGDCNDISFQLRQPNFRTYKEHTLDGITVPDQYVLNKEDFAVDYIAVLEGLKSIGLTSLQNQAIDYAIKCIYMLEKHKDEKH